MYQSLGSKNTLQFASRIDWQNNIFVPTRLWQVGNYKKEFLLIIQVCVLLIDK